MPQCLHCQSELAHCHGTLSIHADAWIECSEVQCDRRASNHRFVIDCSDCEECLATADAQGAYAVAS